MVVVNMGILVSLKNGNIIEVLFNLFFWLLINGLDKLLGNWLKVYCNLGLVWNFVFRDILLAMFLILNWCLDKCVNFVGLKWMVLILGGFVVIVFFNVNVLGLLMKRFWVNWVWVWVVSINRRFILFLYRVEWIVFGFIN